MFLRCLENVSLISISHFRSSLECSKRVESNNNTDCILKVSVFEPLFNKTLNLEDGLVPLHALHGAARGL